MQATCKVKVKSETQFEEVDRRVTDEAAITRAAQTQLQVRHCLSRAFPRPFVL